MRQGLEARVDDHTRALMDVNAFQKSTLAKLATHDELIARVVKDVEGLGTKMDELKIAVNDQAQHTRADALSWFRWLLGLFIALGLLNGAGLVLHR